jgi:hypothetical protein
VLLLAAALRLDAGPSLIGTAASAQQQLHLLGSSCHEAGEAVVTSTHEREQPEQQHHAAASGPAEQLGALACEASLQHAAFVCGLDLPQPQGSSSSSSSGGGSSTSGPGDDLSIRGPPAADVDDGIVGVFISDAELEAKLMRITKARLLSRWAGRGLTRCVCALVGNRHE